MALSSYANSRLVMRLGARRILLFALSAFTLVSAAHLVVAATASEGLWLFVSMQAMTMIFFGMIGANAGALAMEPLREDVHRHLMTAYAAAGRDDLVERQFERCRQVLLDE